MNKEGRCAEPGKPCAALPFGIRTGLMSPGHDGQPGRPGIGGTDLDKDHIGDGAIKPEDYVEPRCVLCGDPYGAEPRVKAVSAQRIIAKMNEYMSRRDYAGAERHLLYWLEEARLGKDERGELMLRNELTGHYRKTGERDKSLENAEKAVALVEALSLLGTMSAGTTFVNAATAYSAFGEQERALELFGRAKESYEEDGHTDPGLLGGLYNNMANAYAALSEYGEASAYYEKALRMMESVPGGEPERAVTCLNMADVIEKRDGMEKGEKEIFALLDEALSLLDGAREKTDPGYYAFVCEKCAPAFSYYGYFLAAEDLKARAEAVYGRE